MGPDSIDEDLLFSTFVQTLFFTSIVDHIGTSWEHAGSSLAPFGEQVGIILYDC